MATKEIQFKNSITYLIPVIVGSLLPLITLPIFTRILSADDYGVLALASVYAVFSTGIANFGLIVSFERNYFQYRDQGKVPQLLYSILVFLSLSLFIFGIVTSIFKADLARLVIGSPEHANLLLWSFCFSAVESLKQYFFIYFKNAEDAKAYTGYTVLGTVVGVILALCWVVFARVGVVGLIWGPLAGSLVVTLFLSVKFFKQMPFAWSSAILLESLKMSLPLTPRSFLKIISGQFDKYMIGLMATVGGVGLYSIGQKISYLVFVYMTSLENVFSPQVYKKMFELDQESGAAIGKYLTPFAYISTAFALLLILFSEEVVFLLTPPSYYGAIDIIMVLAMYYGIQFFGKQPQLIFAKKTYILSVLSFFSIILNVALNIPFIMKWGAGGAAWATLVAGIISGAMYFVVSQRYYEIRWEYGKLLLIYGVFFLSSFLLLSFRALAVGYPYRILLKGLVVAAFIWIGMAMKIITKENILLLKGVFSRTEKLSGTPG